MDIDYILNLKKQSKTLEQKIENLKSQKRSLLETFDEKTGKVIKSYFVLESRSYDSGNDNGEAIHGGLTFDFEPLNILISRTEDRYESIKTELDIINEYIKNIKREKKSWV